MPTASTDTIPPRILLLMGVSGCGKTTVGKRLEEQLGCPFVDADDLHPPGNKDLISERLAARKGHFMPPDLLRSQFATLEEPGPEEGRSVDISGDPEALVK